VAKLIQITRSFLIKYFIFFLFFHPFFPLFGQSIPQRTLILEKEVSDDPVYKEGSGFSPETTTVTIRATTAGTADTIVGFKPPKIDIFLAIDNSGSMDGGEHKSAPGGRSCPDVPVPFLAPGSISPWKPIMQLIKAANNFVNKMGINDRIGIGSYYYSRNLNPDPNGKYKYETFPIHNGFSDISQRGQLKQTINDFELYCGNGTSTWHGTWKAVEYALNNKRPDAKAVVIAMTDGQDQKSDIVPDLKDEMGCPASATAHSCLIDYITAHADEVQVYSVLLGSKPGTEQNMRDVARAGGGKFYFTQDASDLDSIYNEIGLEIRSYGDLVALEIDSTTGDIPMIYDVLPPGAKLDPSSVNLSGPGSNVTVRSWTQTSVNGRTVLEFKIGEIYLNQTLEIQYKLTFPDTGMQPITTLASDDPANFSRFYFINSDSTIDTTPFPPDSVYVIDPILSLNVSAPDTILALVEDKANAVISGLPNGVSFRPQGDVFSFEILSGAAGGEMVLTNQFNGNTQTQTVKTGESQDLEMEFSPDSDEFNLRFTLPGTYQIKIGTAASGLFDTISIVVDPLPLTLDFQAPDTIRVFEKGNAEAIVNGMPSGMDYFPNGNNFSFELLSGPAQGQISLENTVSNNTKTLDVKIGETGNLDMEFNGGNDKLFLRFNIAGTYQLVVGNSIDKILDTVTFVVEWSPLDLILEGPNNTPMVAYLTDSLVARMIGLDAGRIYSPAGGNFTVQILSGPTGAKMTVQNSINGVAETVTVTQAQSADLKMEFSPDSDLVEIRFAVPGDYRVAIGNGADGIWDTILIKVNPLALSIGKIDTAGQLDPQVKLQPLAGQPLVVGLIAELSSTNKITATEYQPNDLFCFSLKNDNPGQKGWVIYRGDSLQLLAQGSVCLDIFFSIGESDPFEILFEQPGLDTLVIRNTKDQFSLEVEIETKSIVYFTLTTRDLNGNGYLDSLHLAFNVSVLLDKDKLSLKGIGGKEFTIQSLLGGGTDYTIVLSENNDEILETHLTPSLVFDSGKVTRATTGETFALSQTNLSGTVDGAGPVIEQVHFDSKTCAAGDENPVLTVLFSEDINFPNGSNGELIAQMAREIETYLVFLNRGQFDPTLTAPFGPFGVNQIRDITFSSSRSLTIKISGNPTVEVSDFFLEVNQDAIELKMGPGSGGQAFQDSTGNKVSNKNKPVPVFLVPDSRNLICDIKQISNSPSPYVETPYNITVIQLNGSLLAPDLNSSGVPDPNNAGKGQKIFQIKFGIFDLLGNLVYNTQENAFATEQVSVINHTHFWDKRNLKGRLVSSGGYIGVISAVVVYQNTFEFAGKSHLFPPLKILVKN